MINIDGFKIFEDSVYHCFFRFYELYDWYKKTDGRISLIFEDNGYVDDIDLFLTVCFSNYKLRFTIDGSSVNKVLLSDTKQFKTLIDFYEGKITCQGKTINEIKPSLKRKFHNLKLIAVCTYPSIDDKEAIIKFLTNYK